ncbi:MAG TPA: helix-turn-helix domain-containing protein [Actinomycetota bacterium]
MEIPSATMADIGDRLKVERVRQGISQRALADRLGLSASLISQIETGRSKPSVSTLYSMVTELGISLDSLFGDDEAAPAADQAAGPGVERGQEVVRPHERHVIELESGVRWERLTSDHEDEVDFLYVTYDVGGASSADGTLMRHSGREYGHLISGQLGVQIRFKKYLLEPGDSIAFDSTQPHRLWNPGAVPARALWYVVGRDG